MENAVGHGVEPQLAGGEVVVGGQRVGADVVFSVRDNGPGPAPDIADGVGLANARQRLQMAGGSAAQWHVGPAPGGGCLAEFRRPWNDGPA